MSASREALAHDFPGPSGFRLRDVGLAVAVALLAAVVGGHVGPGPVTVPIGGFDAPYRGGPWGKALRADLDPQASRDGRLTFYFRPLRDGAQLRLPLVSQGAARVSFRARATVRSSLGTLVGGV